MHTIREIDSIQLQCNNPKKEKDMGIKHDKRQTFHVSLENGGKLAKVTHKIARRCMYQISHYVLCNSTFLKS